jgi:hypothetical protein
MISMITKVQSVKYFTTETQSQKLKDISPQRHRGTEFYLVNSACGAVNNTKLFSVPLCLCGESFLNLF